ncbi:RNAse P, Rpr2/Rpp21 subunit [Methanohalobium evestigatum Z-7303]|uniref:Ribonuclease P protein component 4 n=2 Tax=Methanohalobium TaxID=2321 RepID=D7EB80_METEZ|nr:ribonuclease P protein component 4 [Methanohalobium evestigatum]ADI74597.1 RNAse P, Rpr2/Rpp21 subunit [Methanohalobium evestigatum Z-7303]
MGRARKKKKVLIKDIAYQRIQLLFSFAENEARQSNLEWSNRYAYLARKIGMKYRIRLPPELKRRICKQCNSYLLPGKTSRVRLKNNNVTVTCLNCGNQKRYPYKN